MRFHFNSPVINDAKQLISLVKSLEVFVYIDRAKSLLRDVGIPTRFQRVFKSRLQALVFTESRQRSTLCSGPSDDDGAWRQL